MANHLLTLISPETNSIGFSAIFTLIMFAILVIVAIHVYYKSQESFKLGILIPGPDPLPILGNALMALGRTPNGKLPTSMLQLDQTKCDNFVIL